MFAVELETDLAEATGTDPRRVEAIILYYIMYYYIYYHIIYII